MNINLQFRTEAARTLLFPTCVRVVAQFRLPEIRTLVFLDTDNPPDFEKMFGRNHCGFHTPLAGAGDFPPYVEALLYHSDGNFAFDNIIFLNRRATSTVPGTTITLAHELQHLVQYGQHREIWQQNVRIYNFFAHGPATPLQAWDIPHELDAVIRSKKVAEAVLGKECVAQFALSQIQLGHHSDKWRHFLSTDSSETLSLAERTALWIAAHQQELKGLSLDSGDE